jgi:RHS repeat-associated protein
LGQLLQVDTPEQAISYRHNAMGQRVAKLVDGVVTEQYLWQDLTTLLAIYDGAGHLRQRFEYTLGHTPTSFTQDGQRYFIQTDHLGSPRVITDGSGNLVKVIDYDSYGNVTQDSNPAFAIPFGFAGGLQDADTGLIRFGYRDYDPETGRWTARDPIGFAGGDTNLYGYVLGDPVSGLDLTGLARFAIRPLEADIRSNHTPKYDPVSTRGIYHEHLFYEDQAGGNVGSFKDTGIGPDPGYPGNRKEYVFIPIHYDDARMRRAQRNVDQGFGQYDMWSNNCQNYADQLRREYKRLEWEDFLTNTFPNNYVPSP